jgi:hypothetical protein
MDPAHGTGGGGEEVGAVPPLDAIEPDEAGVGLVD